jgi:hypothetical protein
MLLVGILHGAHPAVPAVGYWDTLTVCLVVNFLIPTEFYTRKGE